MSFFRSAAKVCVPAGLLLAAISFAPAPARAQDPVVIPIVADTAVPMIINAIKPKTNANGLAKFQGTVMNANIAQITVRAKGSDMSIQTFSLSQQASAKMQHMVDKGGYQYGDKVTVMYNPSTRQAVSVKGKATKPTPTSPI
jgi:hypothetical protein